MKRKVHPSRPFT